MAELNKKQVMKTELCRILNKIGALKFGTFKLASGIMSPYYIDLRIVPSFPDAFKNVCRFYIELIKANLEADQFERVAGIPVASIPFASFVAFTLEKPFLYVRRGIRTHGRERKVEGIIMPGDRVLLIDDLITSGNSLIKAAEAINAEGGIVTDAVVLVDREERGKANLAKLGIRLHWLLKISEAVNTLHKLGTITEDQLDTILKQIKT